MFILKKVFTATQLLVKSSALDVLRTDRFRIFFHLGLVLSLLVHSDKKEMFQMIYTLWHSMILLLVLCIVGYLLFCKARAAAENAQVFPTGTRFSHIKPCPAIPLSFFLTSNHSLDNALQRYPTPLC